VEYAFDGAPTLRVPGDFNTQLPELFYVEGTVWYKKTFTAKRVRGKRLFLHFGAVNYKADVYLNGKLLGSHEGGFTPFQFEITGDVQDGPNALIVKANNQRQKDGLPALGYDWFNYGGITRDVHLVETPATFIEDYSVQLQKHSPTLVSGWVKLNGVEVAQVVRIRIPELKVAYTTQAGKDGLAEVRFSARPRLWSPKDPKLYEVIIQSETDTVREHIGFRNIEVQGTRILLNGEPLFVKGVNIHEERPLGGGKAWSEADAVTLLSWAKELGCNLVRLAHYPHNEYMVRLAEKMGLMVWDELPVYQHIEFAAPMVPAKMERMLNEMVRRDRNRCGVVIWSLSNETYATTPKRTESLITLSQQCRRLDSTRLVVSVINNQGYDNHTLNVWDTLYRHFDVLAVNEYLGPGRAHRPLPAGNCRSKSP
jgi:beta-glucuronidase